MFSAQLPGSWTLSGLPLFAVTLTAVPRAPVGARESETRYRLGRIDRTIVP